MKRLISLFAATCLLLSSIPVALAATIDVDFTVRGVSTIGVEGAEVTLYVYNETTELFESQGVVGVSNSSGILNNVPVEEGSIFYGVADDGDITYAHSNQPYSNIWVATTDNSIVNAENDITRGTKYVHLYPGEQGEYDSGEGDGESDPEPTPETADDDDDDDDDEDLEVDPIEGDFEVEITVYDNERNPIEGATVHLYVTDSGIYSTDLTGGAGRTDEIMAPAGISFYAIATDDDGNSYGGTYDYYYNRANYWMGEDGETIENTTTGLTRLAYLHLYPEEFVPAGFDDDSAESTFDPETYECGGFPDAVYVSITPEECAAVEYVHTEGIFTGTDAGDLEWNRAINRAEVTKVMLEAFDIEDIDGDPSIIFPDVPLTGAWFSDYVYQAVKHAIVGGYPDGTFLPANTINRVELLRIFIEASGADLSSTPTNYTFWHDVSVGPDTEWFIGYANYAFFNDLLENDGDLNAGAPMTRMDVIRLLYRSSLLES
jgi:hypothetical protein